MGRNTFLHGDTVLVVLFLRRELAQLRMQGGAATQAQGAQAAEQVAALEARASCAEADAITFRERLDQASGGAAKVQHMSTTSKRFVPTLGTGNATLPERLDQASGEHAASVWHLMCVCSVDYETFRSLFAAVASSLMRGIGLGNLWHAL